MLYEKYTLDYQKTNPETIHNSIHSRPFAVLRIKDHLSLYPLRTVHTSAQSGPFRLYPLETCYRSTRQSLVPLKLLEPLLLVTTSSVGEPCETTDKTRRRGDAVKRVL